MKEEGRGEERWKKKAGAREKRREEPMKDQQKQRGREWERARRKEGKREEDSGSKREDMQLD